MPLVEAITAAILLTAAPAALVLWRSLHGAGPRAGDAAGLTLAAGTGAAGAGAAGAGAARTGAVVNSLRGDGAAARAGLAVGDAVEAVNGRPVAGPAAADAALARAGAGPVTMRVRRAGRTLVVRLVPTPH